MNYQSRAARQLQYYETNKTSAYARPRPRHLLSTSPREKRIKIIPVSRVLGCLFLPHRQQSDSSMLSPVSGSSTGSSNSKTDNLTSETLKSLSNSTDLSPLADVPNASSEPAAQAHPQVSGQPEVSSAPPIPLVHSQSAPLLSLQTLRI